MENNQSVIVLTNFWDANSLIDQGYLIHVPKENEVYKINILVDRPNVKTGVSNNKSNYSVYSIALSHPELSDLKNLSSMIRLDVFCPTYDMLKRYKENSDWEAYIRDYMSLLKERKKRMAAWMDALIGGKVYILCCWENTSRKAHCHREILYRVMSESKVLGEKALVIYRKGNEIKQKRQEQREQEQREQELDEYVTPPRLYVSNRMSTYPSTAIDPSYYLIEPRISHIENQRQRRPGF